MADSPDSAVDGADTTGDEQRVAQRAELLPEEESVGSDDPETQAEAILADSDERTAHPEQAARESPQTPN